MAVDFSNIGSSFGGILSSWAVSIGFWMVVCFALVIVAFLGLVFRKKRKFDKPVIEIYDLGNVIKNPDGSINLDKSTGIFDFVITKGGWFKNRFTFFGLWDYGNENLFRLKDLTPVYDVSHNDYRKIGGVNGLIVIRNPNDSRFAIPISKFFLSSKSKAAIADIAPVDMRSAAVGAIENVDTEMKTKWEKIMPILAIGFVSIILIFSILLIAQYGKHNIEQTTALLKYVADKMGLDKAALISGAP